MEATLEQTKLERMNLEHLLFNVPTPITKLEPIFTFDFKLTDFPSFTINLNPKLKKATKLYKFNQFIFNEVGYCNFELNEVNDYFIKGEFKLIAMDSDEVSHCKMIIDYGKGSDEQFLLKGTFKLSNFSV